MFQRALISVSDKTGLAEFIRPLADAGMEVVSTGGTARYLRENGIEVLDVSEQTQFPEVMDGRVKTLHPNIHMALLARAGSEDMNVLKSYGLKPFDLVVGNLYPFEEAMNNTRNKQRSDLQQMDYVDIGGPSFLRAAAKNFERLTVVCDPQDYSWVLKKSEELVESDRKYLASKVFAHTASYDSMIAHFLGLPSDNPDQSFEGRVVQELRYGENPQQTALWLRRRGQAGGLDQAEVLQGKALSYNNLLDLDAACRSLLDLKSEWACVGVKHSNPCGVGLGSSVSESVDKALRADPVSIFGGIVAINQEVDVSAAEALKSLFLECVIAPSYSRQALEILSKKKNLRLLRWPRLEQKQDGQESKIRSILGGLLVQDSDRVQGWSSTWQVFGQKVDEDVRSAAELSWKVCAHLKSNAISICSAEQSLGLGMGQVNRVDAVQQAIHRMNHFHPNADKAGLVMASDAFFPFPDSVELAAGAGIRWIVQPGGSIKDDDVKLKARELGVNLIFTGVRHFNH